jgi:hypothetical protein
MRRIVIGFAIAVLAGLSQQGGALACGALVAPNGSVRLSQATTFVAFHDGVEHYVTSFSYQGDVPGLGYIIPLPAIPTKIESAGRWTLQRLEREFAPVNRFAEGDAVAAAAPTAQVIQQVQVEALDVTVLKGTGDEIVAWCAKNGFILGDEDLAHLRLYGQASPIFLAAKYDLTRARAQGLLAADGTPVQITMNVPHLWVPLEVLAASDEPGEQTDADLFLLTDSALSTGAENFIFPSTAGRELPGAPGFRVTAEEPMNESLFVDLSSDRNMGWVPAAGTVTYLHMRASAPTVTYDLAVDDGSRIHLAHLGTSPETAATTPPVAPFVPAQGSGWSLLFAVLPAVLMAGAGLVAAVRRRQRPAGVGVTSRD